MSSKNEGSHHQPALKRSGSDRTPRLSRLRADLIASFDASSLSRLEQFVAGFDQSKFAWYPSRPALPLTAEAAADWVVELCGIVTSSARAQADFDVDAYEAEQLSKAEARVGKLTGLLNAALSVIRESYAMSRYNVDQGNAPSHDTPARMNPEDVSAASIIFQKAIAWQYYWGRVDALGVKDPPQHPAGPGAPRQHAKRDLEEDLCGLLLQTGLTQHAIAHHVFSLASLYGLASKSPKAIEQRLSRRRK
ncbi:MAG TPA: hypothetical protein VGU20_01190 [Stellaceae bacterium]|nr:hypothetical protein [Stellaceae bacterium]